MEAKKVWSELFEKEVKKVEGLGLAGVGRKRVEEVKGHGKGRGGVGNAAWGFLTVQIESDQKEERAATAVKQNGSDLGEWRGRREALVPFITLE